MFKRKNGTTIVFGMLVLALVFAGAALAQSEGNTIDFKIKDGIGPYLVDANGMTLYYFKNDSPGKSACVGPCVEKWPVFYTEKVIAPAMIDAKDVGEITRAGGKKQTTYKGRPLYHFSGDKAAGDTMGQGFKDVWYVVNP